MKIDTVFIGIKWLVYIEDNSKFEPFKQKSKHRILKRDICVDKKPCASFMPLNFGFNECN